MQKEREEFPTFLRIDNDKLKFWVMQILITLQFDLLLFYIK